MNWRFNTNRRNLTDPTERTLRTQAATANYDLSLQTAGANSPVGA